MPLTPDLIAAVAGPFASAVLLFVVLVWYMPARDKAHQQTIQRIIDSHSKERTEDHNQMRSAILENTKATKYLARAVLISQFMSMGMTEPEAEREACRIIANGIS